MQSSLEKLRKFFRLEHENGYSNTAIIGGLAKMLDFWEAEARADGINEEVIQAVGQRLRSYDGLSPQSRADALKGLWKRIGDTYPETQQRSQQRPRSQQPGPRPAPTTDQPRPHSEHQGSESHPQQAKLRPPTPPHAEINSRCKAQPNPRRAQRAADRSSRRRAASCTDARRTWNANAGRHALLFSAPLRRLFATQADQEFMVWRAGDCDRHDPVRAYAANSRRLIFHY